MGASNLEVINVDDWDTFIMDNEDIITKLNNMSSDTADILANAYTTYNTVKTVQSELAKLITVKGNIDFRTQEDTLKDKADAMVEKLGQKSIKVIAGIKYSEAVLQSYNQGEELEEVAIWKEVYDWGADSGAIGTVFKSLAAYGPLKDKDALGFIIIATGDLLQKGYTNTNEKGVDNLVKLVTKLKTYKDPAYEATAAVWQNAHIGTAVAFIVETAVDIAADKGIFDTTDVTRLGVDVFGRAITTLTDTVVTDAVTQVLTTSGVGALAGPAGVVAGFAISYPMSIVFGEFQDAVVGDIIVDTFEYNGVKYTMPRNGSGKEYTYDVMLENYRKYANEWKIGYKSVTEDQYYDSMYEDWSRFVERDTDKPISDFATDEARENLNSVLEDLKNAYTYDDEEDFMKYYEQLSTEGEFLYRELGFNYDFSFDGYYRHYYGGDIIS